MFAFVCVLRLSLPRSLPLLPLFPADFRLAVKADACPAVSKSKFEAAAGEIIR